MSYPESQTTLSHDQSTITTIDMDVEGHQEDTSPVPLAAPIPISRRRKSMFIFDNPENAKVVFEWAVEHVFQQGKDHVTLVDLFTSDPANSLMNSSDLWNLTAGTEDAPEHEIKAKRQSETIDQQLENLRYYLTSKNILSQKLTVSDKDPRARLLQLINAQNPEFVVVGHSVPSFFQRTLYGSLDEYLNRNCSCSVFVIKPKHHPYQ